MFIFHIIKLESCFVLLFNTNKQVNVKIKKLRRIKFEIRFQHFRLSFKLDPNYYRKITWSSYHFFHFLFYLSKKNLLIFRAVVFSALVMWFHTCFSFSCFWARIRNCQFELDLEQSIRARVGKCQSLKDDIKDLLSTSFY
jgi:hypothetical protein